jgi:cytochrome P450
MYPLPLQDLAALRAQGPVHRIHVPGSGDAWLVVGRDVARGVLADPRLCNDIRYSASWESDGGRAIGRNMLQSDPPRHSRLRRLVAGHFSGGRVGALGPRVEEIAGELIGVLPRRGIVDVVGAYALPLPVTVICELLGVPGEERGGFHAWSNELVMPTSPEAADAAGVALAGCLTELTRRRGTLLGDLAEELDGEELLGMAFLLLVAGHETTVNLISATLHALLSHPEQLALLRDDPGLTESAVEEALRHNSPVHTTAFRFAAEPLELAGVPIAAGDAVLVSLAAASRDPLHFPEPDRFDITRRTAGHLGFGHGLHHCLGAPLARMEATVAVRLLLRHRPALAFATDPAELTWRSSTLLRGLAELPVRIG